MVDHNLTGDILLQTGNAVHVCSPESHAEMAPSEAAPRSRRPRSCVMPNRDVTGTRSSFTAKLGIKCARDNTGLGITWKFEFFSAAEFTSTRWPKILGLSIPRR